MGLKTIKKLLETDTMSEVNPDILKAITDELDIVMEDIQRTRKNELVSLVFGFGMVLGLLTGLLLFAL